MVGPSQAEAPKLPNGKSRGKVRTKREENILGTAVLAVMSRLMYIFFILAATH